MDTAPVTGANKSIGREIARRLVAEGMTVYLGARDVARGQEATDAVGARFVQLDVTDEEQVAKAVAGIDRLDVLVNNAGVALDWGVAVPDMSAALLRATYEVNVFGCSRTARPGEGVGTVEQGAEVPVRLALGEGGTAGFHGEGRYSADGRVPW